MQYDVIFAYLRLSRDDKEKIEESNSIKKSKAFNPALCRQPTGVCRGKAFVLCR